MSELGSLKDSIAVYQNAGRLLSGLFCDNLINIDIYDRGLVLHRKKSRDTIPFENIEKIKATNFFAPIADALEFSLIGIGGVKNIEFTLEADKKDAYLLLESHRDVQLGSDFPMNINALSLNLGGIKIEQGILIETVKKQVRHHSLEDIDEFIYDKGQFYFTLNDSAHRLLVDMNSADNCLSTIAIGKFIMQKHKPKNLF